MDCFLIDGGCRLAKLPLFASSALAFAALVSSNSVWGTAVSNNFSRSCLLSIVALLSQSSSSGLKGECISLSDASLSDKSKHSTSIKNIQKNFTNKYYF